MHKYQKIFLYLWQNKFLTLVCFILPLILSFVMTNIFYKELPRELPIGILDEDNTTISKEIIFNLNATSILKVEQKYSSIHAAKDDLSDGKIYGLVVIPHALERNTKMGIQTKIILYYNAQFVLIGKAIDSAFLGVIATMNAKSDATREMSKNSNINEAISQAMPIVSKIYALYNSNNNYKQFLLTLILPCIWQILMALGMLNILSKTRTIRELLIGFGINIVIFVSWGMAMLQLFQALGYPMTGSYYILFLGVLVMVAGISGMVICFQSILRDLTKTVSVIAVYTAPSLAFVGITYPQNNMDGFALFWSHILPVSYFIQLYLQQANYSLEIADALKIIAQMLPFLLFLPLGFLIEYFRGKQ
ncbi:ABC transporter permease [Helicobacter sp. 11S03491-1]|uniref:ABC transporter permease n=1 Tax=Helicobacter sp. 11S03491-1 TaxID=1476196 RepID=UPI000BA69321|nr:ABC transporter permease [Helicobacter sp. 11S03491-1]PAF41227.1 hypothetical protein BKH45_07645 [Helicobacter sp. 11S03491-1]